jgi:nicotinate-nucleotide adenylyltransferase
MRRGFPLAYPGMRIGLFGGSFDPAHEGHAHVAETALKRLGLDAVWWLVTPQNPLKPKSTPLKTRMDSARRFVRGRKMAVTDIESRLGARYTYQTLRALKTHYPGVRFTFVMGADNLENFRKWRHWREVARAVPIAVIARPDSKPCWRMNLPKSWVYLFARLNPQSSAALRAKVAEAAPG